MLGWNRCTDLAAPSEGFVADNLSGTTNEYIY